MGGRCQEPLRSPPHPSLERERSGQACGAGSESWRMTGTGWGTVSYAKDASGLLGVGETVKGGLVPAELLVVEWPEVLSPRVHVPRNGGPPET